VALATHNGERFLEEQLNSLAGQHRLPDELHVGDDGSSDGTIGILEAFRLVAPFPVYIRRNEERLGYGENFVRTALRCSGEWIAFCDQDDIWLPQKLAVCADRISRASPDLCLIAHNAEIVDENLRHRGKLYDYSHELLHPRLSLPPEWHCTGFTQVFRRRLLDAAPTRPRPSFPWHPHREAHDVWIALLANALGSILQVDEPLALYRRHASTVTEASTAGGFWERARRTASPQGDDYAARSSYLRDVAAILQGCPDNSALAEATRKIEAQARHLECRARIYEGRNFAERIGGLLDLIRGGGYWGGAGWPFGASRLVKDALYAVAA
jgi:glycosyltransferase involved in cell wall biosynthesis